LGLEQVDMAEMLGVRPNTYQSWESGRDPIPTGIWAEIEALFERFDREVAEFMATVPEGGDKVRVRVWRTRKDELPPNRWWQRIVAEGMRRDPRIEPVFPEDDKDD
jgi:transcriptional regulator with XRE-family HTH domain